MKKYEVKAKRAMQCGESTKQPGDVIATIEYADDVPAEFIAHAIGSDLVTCEPVGEAGSFHTPKEEALPEGEQSTAAQ